MVFRLYIGRNGGKKEGVAEERHENNPECCKEVLFLV